MSAIKSERIQLRATSHAREQIRRAAEITQQDTTSFILDAATAKARAVLLEDRVLQFTSNELEQLEEAMSGPAEASPILVNLLRRVKQDEQLSR